MYLSRCLNPIPMKRNFYSIKTSALLLFAVILLLTSCNSKKLTSDYPNIYSVHDKKSGFRSANRHKTDHSKIAFKDFVKSDFSSVSNSESLTKSEENSATQLKSAATKSDMLLIKSISALPIPDYNHGTLTASLSDKPFIPAYRFRPDTTIKTTVPALDTTTNKVSQTPPPDVKKDGKGKVTEKTNREIFAIISPIIALLAIGTLFLALPGVFILLASAAIIFGALGLKSRRRKLATLGLIIGILEALFLLGAILYVSIVGFSGGL